MRISATVLVAAILTPLALSASAQTAAPASEVISLSPFEVSSDAVRGYATTSSTSASRIAVPITDISNSIIAINEELIADTLAVTAEDTLNLVGGVSAFAETQSQEMNKFSMRGYTSSNAQRDGFTDFLYGLNGGFSYTFIERMEVLKGPNGILYGQNNPGGLLNLVSKKPLAKPRTKLSLMGGSYDFYRADLDTSGFVDNGHALGYRLSASYSNNNGPLNHPADVNRSKGFFALNPVVRYRTKDGLEVWAWSGFVRDSSPRLKRIAKGFRTPDGKGAYLTEIADNGGAHNVLTNGAKVTNNSYELGAAKSFDFGPVHLDARVLGRAIDLVNTSTLVNATGGIDVYVDQAGNIIGSDGRTIDYSRVVNNLGGSYRSVAVQLTGSNNHTKTQTYATDFAFTFKAGPTENKFLVFGTYDKLKQTNIPGIDGKTYQVSSLASLQKIGADVVGNTARIWLYPLSKETLAGISPETVIANSNSSSAQATTVQDNNQYSYGGIERMSVLDKKLFLVAGARMTSIDSTNQTGTAAASDTNDDTWSTSLGAVAKIYRGEKGQAALFYNANETFIPVFAIDQRKGTFGDKFPNRDVSIHEYGVKLDLLDSRLVTTASWYRTFENNVLISNVDVDGTVTGVTGRSYQSPAGNARTVGWDIDAAYNAAKGLDFTASYGLMHTRLSDGHRTSGQPADTVSLLGRYEVQTGMLKGVSLLWNYTWWGDSILNNRTYWKIPPGDQHTAVIGYKFRRFTVRLRIENVFDVMNVRPSVNETAVGVLNHRNYRLSFETRW